MATPRPAACGAPSPRACAAPIPNAGHHSPEEQPEPTVEHNLRFADGPGLP
jgi:hypothetical protein